MEAKTPPTLGPSVKLLIWQTMQERTLGNALNYISAFDFAEDYWRNKIQAVRLAMQLKHPEWKPHTDEEIATEILTQSETRKVNA